jgi:hypothetical protein
MADSTAVTDSLFTPFKYAVVLVTVYLVAWTASYAVAFVSRGDGLGFTYFFEYLRLAWTFSGGELPSLIWLFSVITFLPLASVSVFLLRRYARRKKAA